MLRSIAVIPILGLPLVVYLGIFTLVSFGVTAFIGYSNYKKINQIPFKWHPRMVIVSFSIAGVHALLALSLFL